jgi:hypothetical protein
MRIHIELGNSPAATSGRSEYQPERAIPLEMLAPRLLAWVKERDDNTSIRSIPSTALLFDELQFQQLNARLSCELFPPADRGMMCSRWNV